MAKRVIFDTNILIGLLNGTIKPEDIADADQVFISTMSLMEIFALA